MIILRRRTVCGTKDTEEEIAPGEFWEKVPKAVQIEGSGYVTIGGAILLLQAKYQLAAQNAHNDLKENLKVWL